MKHWIAALFFTLAGTAMAAGPVAEAAKAEMAKIARMAPLAILAWDVYRKEYRMQSSLADTRTGSFPGKVEDGKFVWRMEPESAPWSRFTISFEDADRWLEAGESSRDGGKTWFKLFETDLRRVK